MKAYIISIGDELLLGQTVNTNASYIGEKLSDLNIDVAKTSVIRDNASEIKDEFKIAWNISDVLLVTGGLGPTHDDITRNCVVEFFNTKLTFSEDVLDNIKALFKKRNREVTDVNEDQANVPKIAQVIRNDKGTAPGYWIEKDAKIFIVMPGVPYEMEGMMNSFVIPRLQEMTGDKQGAVKRLVLNTTGIPESYLFEKLGDLDEILGEAKLAFLPNPYGVKLRITVKGDDEGTVNNKLIEVEQKIRAKAGRFIYGKNDDSLESVVGKLLEERDLTISVAESCTGGSLANHLTNVSGSGKYFDRGVVCYSNAAKVEILKVNEDVLIEHGAVSREVAMQMAEGVRSTSGTDIGVSTTGIMGPTGATTDKPVGLVYIGFCDEKVCTARKVVFGGDRLLNKQRTVQAALDLVRRHVLGISVDD
ncbi:MAG: competence/damage-inducible protein A [Ignavibacteriaceae bacterium]